MTSALMVIKNVRLSLPAFFRQADIDRLVKALKLRSDLYGYFNPSQTLISYPGRFHLTDKKKASHYFNTFISKDGYATANLCILDNAEGRSLLKAIKGDKIKQSRRMYNDPWRFNGVTNNADGFFAFDFINKE